MIGADTSFLIDFLDGDEDAVQFMQEHRDVIHLCENVVYEFLCGNLTDDEKQKFLGFVSHFPVVSFDRDSALTSSEIFRNQKRDGNRIAHPDAQVAGSYKGHQINKIVTRNVKDFEQLKNLEVISY